MIHTKYLDLATGLKKLFKEFQKKWNNFNPFKLPELYLFFLIKEQMFL